MTDALTHLVTVITPQSPLSTVSGGGPYNILRHLRERAVPSFLVPRGSDLEEALMGNAISDIERAAIHAYRLDMPTSHSTASLFEGKEVEPLNAWHLVEAFQLDTLSAHLPEGTPFAVLFSKQDMSITICGRVDWSIGHRLELRPPESEEVWPKGTVFLIRDKH